MKTLLVASLFALTVLSARAEDTNTAAVRISVACRQDMRTTCKPGTPASKGGPLKCLQANKAKVAPECRAALDALKGATLPATGAVATQHKQQQSCYPEIMKICNGVKSGELNNCIKEHRSELTEPCRVAFDGALAAPKRP